VFSYDANDNLLTLTDPDLAVISNTYDANDNRLSTTDKNGNLHQYAYDQKDLLTVTTDPLLATTVQGYDLLNRRTSLQDKRGNTTQFSYDAAGRLVTVTDALTNQNSFSYDAKGNRLSATDPLGHTTSYVYDALDRLVTETDPLGNTSTSGYDALGRVISTTNANGQTTSFVYDALGRLVEVQDANGGVVTYTYDQVGNRTAMTDPNGNATTYAYDDLNRLQTKTEALGNVTQYQYDGVGNLVQVDKPNGVVIQYAYDNLDRLSIITYPDASTVTFSYDANGNRLQMVDSLGTQTYQYDALDRRTSHTDPFGNVVGYGYDANGNRTSLVYPGGNTVTYSFDALNRMATVTDWLGNLTQYEYDDASRLILTTNANGTTASYSYDDADRLATLGNHQSDDSLISSYEYTLDKLGNRLQEAREEPSVVILSPTGTSYSLDIENRLTEINGVPNTYDENGNQLSQGAEAIVFDFEDRPVQRLSGATTSTFSYDALGERYERSIGASYTRFVLDTNSTLSNVMAELDSSNTVVAWNVFGIGLVSRISATEEVFFYHYDPRGSAVAVTRSDESLAATYAYDPFGSVVSSFGLLESPYTFLAQQGVQAEAESLYYVRARYYDSVARRFISKDRRDGLDRDTQSANLYVYAANNPVRLVDVSGFSPQEGTIPDDGLTIPLVLNGLSVTAASTPAVSRGKDFAFAPSVPLTSDPSVENYTVGSADVLLPGEYVEKSVCIVLCKRTRRGKSFAGVRYEKTTWEVGLGLGGGVKIGQSTEDPVSGRTGKLNLVSVDTGVLGKYEVGSDAAVKWGAPLGIVELEQDFFDRDTRGLGDAETALGIRLEVSGSLGSFSNTTVYGGGSW